MKINCLSCGYSLDLDEEVYCDYEGQIKCSTCSALLEVKWRKAVSVFKILEADEQCRRRAIILIVIHTADKDIGGQGPAGIFERH